MNIKMKKLFILLTAIILTAPVIAQKNDDNEDRMKALKIAYITEKLELNSETSKLFWPVYNEYHNKKSQQRSRYKPSKNIYDMNEAESVNYVNDCLDAETQMLKLNKKFHEDLNSILTPQQIARLHAAEYDFKRKILKSMHDGGRKSKNNPGEEE